jgi:hypothetical protein
MPKVGDKVRATHGENVLVGFVFYVSHNFVEVDPRLPSQELYVLAVEDGWHFEQIMLPNGAADVV